MRSFILGLIVGLSLGATARLLPLPAPTVRTVSWFREHPQELAATVARCRDNIGIMGTADCQNAEQAGF